MYADDLLAPWYEQTLALTGPLTLFDAHTHIGVNDPDTFKCTAEELLAALAPTGSRAVVFPMHEPDGYPPANDHVIAAAAASGRAARRVLPRRPARRPRRRDPPLPRRRARAASSCTRAPSSSTSTSRACARSSPRRTSERLPILVHAGRGIPALGAHVLELAGGVPARAASSSRTAGVCDLAWIWQRVDEHPNVFFDTAWFSVPDLLALFSHVAPGQILYATDIPFGSPMQEPCSTFRCALQAGLTPEQLASVAGGQLERLVAGEEALDVGPAAGPGRPAHRPAARARRATSSTSAFAIGDRAAATTREYVDLARLACLVGDDAPQAPICRSILELLELHHGLDAGETLPERFTRIHLLVIALVLAATPDVPVC